ncbi:cell growth regulator with EF hand domain protein 1 isoform X2 [Kryptolebias marmoratus]|uniref:Cell growth regulator with EF-hand domain 1 n=2 Tax=Kryptolebias marmoratus TaxID=37003 RepID=A0A3Q3BMW9_KRYMA|nr:cell growth regulator with EF hand domain protein 1 isoform X2 [Kryptolebias marmoratus]XP_017274129.1 cell growth regulator with EF hand domain protein 1 isoform X2 [Kryptolebias marmoratus]XP_017274130.1 cell growth regulator with EF hand domain protein 1 isoform X2 [Kryptolebias marmoratus]
MESHLDQLVSCVLCLYLLLHLGQAAPGLPGTQRENSVDAHPPLLNPFGTGEEERRLLQSYIQSSLKNSQGGPEISSWEQEVFFLFRLYDYDRSGFLDGLEMMKLLSDYNSYHAPGAEARDQVVSMVDFLLQTQDLNQDGLLDPSELLSPSFLLTQGSVDRTPQQQQEVPVKSMSSNSMTEGEHVVEHREEAAAREELQPQVGDQAQQEVVGGEEELIKQTDQHNERENPEAPAGEQDQVHNIPFHQGQPEI